MLKDIQQDRVAQTVFLKYGMPLADLRRGVSINWAVLNFWSSNIRTSKNAILQADINGTDTREPLIVFS
jgi:transposase-like protein